MERVTIPTFDDAIEHLKQNCDLNVIELTTWTEDECRLYEAETGLKIPPSLKHFLKVIGHCVVESNDAFIAQYADGSRSVHETQILMSDKKNFISAYRMFVVDQDWVDQFTLPMVFFGTADAGHSHLLMNGRNPDDEGVYIWERATDPFGTGNNARGVGRVANSLPEFLFNLRPAEEL